MLQNLKELYGQKIAASDGDAGQVKDFYFDDKTWAIRYVAADTGSWLTGRQVLISPHAFSNWDQREKTLHINLSRKQIEAGPALEAHKPVSCQYEMDCYRYYQWPVYWDSGAGWGLGDDAVVSPSSKEGSTVRPRRPPRDDPHLQSARGLTGYDIQATDGTIGHVSGFLMDDRSWAIRDLVVESGRWYSGKEILISPDKIERTSCEDSKIVVKLTKADIRRTPENDVAKATDGSHGAAKLHG